MILYACLYVQMSNNCSVPGKKHVAVFDKYTAYLTTRMAHGTLREFDPKKESIEDFRERFDFNCLAKIFVAIMKRTCNTRRLFSHNSG